MALGAVDEAQLRDLIPGVLAALVHRGADFQTAEDAVQEALVRACETWPSRPPDDPKGWLITTAWRRFLDHTRSDVARRNRETRVSAEPGAGPASDSDDTLQLYFLCAHPSLSASAAVALTLRAVGGLTTRQIAQAYLVPEPVRDVENIDTRGSMARIHLLIDELPQYLPFTDATEGPQHHGHQLLGPSREAFEEAYEAQRRGTFPSTFVIEAVTQSVTDDTLAPKGLHTMTLGIQQLPSELTGTTWAAEKEKWADLVLEDLFTYAPNLREHILDRVIITPDDLHNEYLITDGNIFHGSMMLDQLFGARPIPELANYRTPVRNYYLCGSGTHPGGGVMGANGHNAAKAALADTDGVVSAAPLRSAGTRAPWQQRMVGTLMGTRPGRWFGYQAARQPALRKITAYAARVR